MQLKIVRACIVIAVCFPLWGARAAAPGGESTKEKTVEQVKKNIQVLTGLPASQLNPVMDFMAASLGVRCQHCHVSDSSGWQFEKDDKPEKRTARKMIQMVVDVNARNFAGRTAVSCYTCHRGSNEPASVISLPQPPSSSKNEEKRKDLPVLPSVEQVLGQYETALGGSDALKKISSRLMKGASLDMQGKESRLEVVQQTPGKFVASITMQNGMQLVHGFDGSTGWMSSPRGSRTLPPSESEDLRYQGALFPISRLQELSKVLHMSEKETIGGHAAYVLDAPVGDQTTERYYIDSSSGLLVRKSVVLETKIGRIPDQVDYSDYRVQDGVKIPFTIRIASVDPRDSFTYRFTSVEQNVAIDPNKFNMPAAKK